MSFRNKLSRLEAAMPGARPAPAPYGLPGPPAPPAAADEGRARLLDDLRARIQTALERHARPVPFTPPAVDTVELPFATEDTPHGPLHVRTLRLSAAHRTGRAPIAPARHARPDLLALLALDPTLASCNAEGALFLDTETTGLSGGTGTVAFLVGLAWWDRWQGGRDARRQRDQRDDEGPPTLVLEQILVRVLGEEAPMLQRVHERLAAASMLVTFNGKSFDMPLLRTRFAMARMPAPVSPPHLDLLHVARRVHGKRVRQGCRLVALERDVLGFERLDDVPSGDVSACYLHFLRTGDARALLGVVEHNAWDVVAMAALVGLYGEPLRTDWNADDLAGVARTLRRAGALDDARDAADAAVDRGATPEALRARAEIAKARGDRARALGDFERLAATVDDPSARLELAKLYEHWMKAPERALACVAAGTTERPEQARRRVERLSRKAARLEQTPLPGLGGAARAPSKATAAKARLR